MNRVEHSDPLRSLRKSAEFLGCAPDTLRRYAKTQGLLKYFQIGARGHLRFRQSDLDRFLAQHSRKVAANG
jgi:DNA-binding transcriptional MerR regulator